MKLKDASLLIVDDDEAVLIAVKMLLKGEVACLVTEKNPENLLNQLAKTKIDLVILDMNYKSALNTGNEGFFWLNKIKNHSPEMLVIMITAYAEIDLAIRSMKEGAADFIVKPWRNEQVIDTIRQALSGKLTDNKIKFSLSLPASQIKASHDYSGMIGSSELMEEVKIKIDKIAATDANVLILGENGTGKDLVARLIHEKSNRSSKPFVAVDLGSLTETLFESELFGHKKGAFTDAREDRTGRMEAAEGGTLFLDEIGNISMYQQAKLLSVLQNKQVIRLGTNQVIPLDFRLVSATNIPIYELAAESKFRKDLIYRINTVEIKLPPLRKRGKDILLLADFYLQKYALKHKRPATGFDSDAVKTLMMYSWPGNVRELQHTIERAIIMSDRETLGVSDLDFTSIEQIIPESSTDTLQLKEIEKETIARVVDKHKGNITQAAKELGITRTALYRRLNKYDI